ncbi:MAG: hypothetical protein ACJ79U_12290 [Myxococcales bacterium]
MKVRIGRGERKNARQRLMNDQKVSRSPGRQSNSLRAGDYDGRNGCTWRWWSGALR